MHAPQLRSALRLIVAVMLSELASRALAVALRWASSRDLDASNIHHRRKYDGVLSAEEICGVVVDLGPMGYVRTPDVALLWPTYVRGVA